MTANVVLPAFSMMMRRTNKKNDNILGRDSEQEGERKEANKKKGIDDKVYICRENILSFPVSFLLVPHFF